MLLAMAVPSLRAEDPAEYIITDSDREHWSFQPLVRPVVRQ
jgi:hypothetical protein